MQRYGYFATFAKRESDLFWKFMKQKNKIFVVFLLLVLLCLYACEKEKESLSVDGLVIDLTTAIHKPIFYSDVFDKIEYIKLETTPDCLIESNSYVHLTDKYIVAFYHKSQSAYLFDRKTGKFIKQIGRMGQGPNEYNVLSVPIFDESESILYFDRKKDWIGYHIETGNSSVIKQPVTFERSVLEHNIIISSIKNFIKIDSTAYLGYVNNIGGNDSIRLVVFDKAGFVINTFPNFQTFEPYYKGTDQLGISFKPIIGQFYQYQSSFYFKEETYNDTIYKLTRDSIIPHISFFLGDKQPPYQLLGSSEGEIHDYFNVHVIGECDKHIFFHYYYNRERYFGYFDKTKKQTFVSNSLENGIALFINDMDDAPSSSLIFINNKGERFGLLNAERLANHLENKRGINPRLQHLKNIEYDDNPVVVIATHKK